MTATKQDEAKKDDATPATEPPKPEVMGITRDDHNTRLSFTKDGNLMIVTIPIGKMSPALVHGFLYELHDIVKGWFAERAAIKRKLSLDTRDAASRFNFKNGINKLLRR